MNEETEKTEVPEAYIIYLSFHRIEWEMESRGIASNQLRELFPQMNSAAQQWRKRRLKEEDFECWDALVEALGSNPMKSELLPMPPMIAALGACLMDAPIEAGSLIHEILHLVAWFGFLSGFAIGEEKGDRSENSASNFLGDLDGDDLQQFPETTTPLAPT